MALFNKPKVAVADVSKLKQLPTMTEAEAQALRELGIDTNASPSAAKTTAAPIATPNNQLATLLSRIDARLLDVQSKLAAQQIADDQLYRLLYVNALLQQPTPVGRATTTMLGSAITSSTYVELIKNTKVRPIAVQIQGEFSALSGIQVYLSLSPDGSNEQLVAALGDGILAPAYGNKLTGAIILRPQQSLYIGAVDFTNYPPTASEKFRVRVWSPDEFVTPTAFQR